ncbi:MAG: glycosyltransferase family 2 protein [Sulfurospirillaceae bacterium]|nr:glycosyltransferase family 2 protein [Sulfurospirillaceae bacterium]
MTCSLIITTYNWPDALEQTLKSVLRQTHIPDEVIIADDGSTDATKALIEKFSLENPQLNIIHSWQEDEGFRASASRNKAIARSHCKYIVLVDGDMILEQNFISDHLKFAKDGYFTQGSRVLVKEAKTKEIFDGKVLKNSWLSCGISNRKNAIHSNVLSKIFSKKSQSLRGIKTCNFAFFREDCIRVNGFNEDFIGWGREDSEFAIRLLNSGIQRQNLRFNAVAFHLYHKENSRKMLEKNDEILQESVDKKLMWCQNGIDKYLAQTLS